MIPPFYTIGHSNRSLQEFVNLIMAAEVRCVVDVRRFPRSRTNPQFNLDVLEKHLADSDIVYQHIAPLGGRRGRTKQTAPSQNTLWENKSFRHYADYAATQAFHDALRKLRGVGHARPTAIMCAEAVWWRCHRRIIADYLIATGESVFHILGPGRPQPAKLTPGAVIEGGAVTYPSPAAGTDTPEVD